MEEDYEKNFRRMFGDERMDAVIGSVEGSVRFYGLTPKSMKLEAKMGPEWKKFIDFYGLPEFKPTKDIHHKWNISKKHRGTYYDEFRRKVGQMKA